MFSAYKQRTKVSLVYLKCKQQEDRYSWCIFKYKCHKPVERTYFERSKQQTRYRRRFWMWKCLPKGNNYIIGLSQQRRKVQCMYWAFKKVIISSKKKLRLVRKIKGRYEWYLTWLKMQQDRCCWCNYKLNCKKQQR